jgi:hypothetical protein
MINLIDYRKTTPRREIQVLGSSYEARKRTAYVVTVCPSVTYVI